MIASIINQANMYKKTVKCGSCNAVINISNGYNIYRTCDSYVCSPSCSRILLSNIAYNDPTLESPESWYNTKKRNVHAIRKTQSLTNVMDYEYPPELTFGAVTDDIENNLETIIEEKSNSYKWGFNSLIGILCGVVVYSIFIV